MEIKATLEEKINIEDSVNYDLKADEFLNKSTKKKAEELSIQLDNFFVKKENFKEENNRMFALYGGWGTGKTTLLIKTKEFLENNSEKLKTKNKYKIVWFKPWEYDNEGKNLDLKLLSKIEREIEVSILTRLLNFFKRYGQLFIITLLIVIVFMIWSFKKIWFTDLYDFINNLQTVYLLLVAIDITIFIVLIFKIFSNSKIGFNILSVIHISFPIKSILKDIKSFHFKNTEIKTQFSKILDKNKVIVFVDDLDRCQGETVLNLMEHIKHFYSVDNILFVFAIDQEKLAQYVVNKYGYKSNDNSMLIDKVTHISYTNKFDLRNDYDQYSYVNNNLSLKEGYAYLDKFFSQSYRLQYMAEVRNFMRKIYHEESILDKLNEQSNLGGIDLQEMFYQLVEFYGTFNLRKVGSLVRKFAEVFRKSNFSYYIINNENREFSLEQIFRVLIIKEFYPELLHRKDWRSASFDSSDLKYTSLQMKSSEYHLLGSEPLPSQQGFIFKEFSDREVTFWHICKFIDNLDVKDYRFKKLNKLDLHQGMFSDIEANEDSHIII